MAGEIWQLAPEAVASAAETRARERRRAATVFVAGAAMVGFLLLLTIWASMADVSTFGSVAPAIGTFGGMGATTIVFAARAAKEAQRMKRVIAVTADPKMSWSLFGLQIVASLDGAPHPELNVPVSPRTRAQLTEVPRATALRT